MTEKLFDLDSYCTRFSASVLSCEPASKNGMQGFAVKLDRTCFFPKSGGQPADTGCLQAGDQSAQVLYTYEQEEAILHLCDQPLPVGSTVEGVLDFERRFANMQIHSGEHILSGLILKELGLHNVGFHMGHESNTIDLDAKFLPSRCAHWRKRSMRSSARIIRSLSVTLLLRSLLRCRCAKAGGGPSAPGGNPGL